MKSPIHSTYQYSCRSCNQHHCEEQDGHQPHDGSEWVVTLRLGVPNQMGACVPSVTISKNIPLMSKKDRREDLSWKPDPATMKLLMIVLMVLPLFCDIVAPMDAEVPGEIGGL
uniref:Uncharacterized protein n=1 Tax=Sphaerodactylus townsendi TaxID=933632 RepID=A0ACB8EEW0_9SAUR